MQHVSQEHTIVSFSGPDAQAFLQSQLTNDVAQLSVGGWQWQGYCSAKGRLYATFALARTGDTDFVAVVHQTVAPALIKRLSMFRLRSKVEILARADRCAVLKLDEPDSASSAVSEGTTRLDFGGGRSISVEPCLQTPESTANDSFMTQWKLRGIEALQPEITAATSEMFVPQMIGWDRVQPGGGVNFQKGCYPGQEIVARAHYRGAVKRHLERVSFAGADPALSEGAELTLPDGRVGEICNIVRRNDAESHILLVVQPHSD